MGADQRSIFPCSKSPLKAFIGAFLFGRLVNLAAMPYEGFRAYSDFISYFEISRLPGLPFIDYWVEYPPFFPFLTKLINHLTGEQEHVFFYLLVILLTLVDGANLYMFYRTALHVMDNSQVLQRSAIYLLVLVALPYGWWYFDPIAVFWVLLGLNLALTRHWGATALTAGIGIITKFFPGLVLASAWRRVSWKYLFIMLTISLIPTIFSYGILWQASPQFTMASFRSQADKGSWETIWALIDGNIRTGSLGPVEERLDPTNAGRPSGNPPTVPLFISLVPFAGIGLAGLVRVKSPGKLQSIAIVGFAWTLFLLWSPGWSPQWILYLLPLILLTLPLKQALLFGIVLVMNSLMEWPVLLSRGYFSFLWIPVVLRTFVLILLCITWGKMMLIDPDTRDSNK